MTDKEKNMGFVMLSRQLLAGWLMRNPTAFCVMIYILMHTQHKATHPNRPHLFNGRRWHLQPGQAVLSQEAIAKHFKLTRKQVRGAIERLTKQGMITTATTPSRGTLTTVIDWESVKAGGLYDSNLPPLPPSELEENDQKTRALKGPNAGHLEERQKGQSETGGEGQSEQTQKGHEKGRTKQSIIPDTITVYEAAEDFRAEPRAEPKSEEGPNEKSEEGPNEKSEKGQTQGTKRAMSKRNSKRVLKKEEEKGLKIGEGAEGETTRPKEFEEGGGMTLGYKYGVQCLNDIETKTDGKPLEVLSYNLKAPKPDPVALEHWKPDMTKAERRAFCVLYQDHLNTGQWFTKAAGMVEEIRGRVGTGNKLINFLGEKRAEVMAYDPEEFAASMQREPIDFDKFEPPEVWTRQESRAGEGWICGQPPEPKTPRGEVGKVAHPQSKPPGALPYWFDPDAHQKVIEWLEGEVRGLEAGIKEAEICAVYLEAQAQAYRIEFDQDPFADDQALKVAAV